jgi:RPA family protein
VVIPLSRKAPDSNPDKPSEDFAESRDEQPVWSYSHRGKRQRERQFCGHVRYLHGTQAERLRGELADVTGKLLVWAGQQQSGDHSTENGSAA